MPIWVYPNLSDTTPAAPDGKRNAKWQHGSPYTGSDGIRRRDTSDYVPNAWGALAVKSADYTPVAADSGKILPCTGTHTITLPTSGSPVLPAEFGSPVAQDPDWELYIQNNGSGTITVAGGGCNIDGSASNVTLSQNQGILVRVTADGSGWQTFRGAGSGSGGIVASSTSFTTTGGAQTVAHGLGYSPTFAVISVGSDGASLQGIVGWQISSPLARWDATNFYIYGSDSGIKGFIDAIK